MSRLDRDSLAQLLNNLLGMTGGETSRRKIMSDHRNPDQPTPGTIRRRSEKPGFQPIRSN